MNVSITRHVAIGLLMFFLFAVLYLFRVPNVQAEIVQNPRSDTDRHLYVVPAIPYTDIPEQEYINCSDPYNSPFPGRFDIEVMVDQAAAAIEEVSNGNAKYTDIYVLPEDQWPMLSASTNLNVIDVGSYRGVHDNIIADIRSQVSIPSDANLMVVTELGYIDANGAEGWADVGNGDMSLWTCTNYWSYEHQMGHNFGLHNSGSNLDVDDGFGIDVAMGSTFNREYDYGLRDFSGAQKWRAGWIDTLAQHRHVVGAADNDDSYTIRAIDLTDSAPQVLRIDDSSGPESLYVDYRVAEGVTSWMNDYWPNQKVFVRSMTSVYPRTEAMLGTGESHVVTDSRGNLLYQINVGSTGGQSAQISVTDCEVVAPNLYVDPVSLTESAGNFFTLELTVFNNNPKGKTSCGDASFDFEVDMTNLTGSLTYDPGNWANVRSGDNGTGPMLLRLSPQATGTVQIPVTVYDVTSLLRDTVTVEVTVTPPDTTAPEPPTNLDLSTLDKGKNCGKITCLVVDWDDGPADEQSGTEMTVVEITRDDGDFAAFEFRYGVSYHEFPIGNGTYIVEVYHVNGAGIPSDSISAGIIF